jgi:hypothetical protein
MAAGVPPPPLNSPAGSYYWLEWYTNLTNFLNGTNIPWANLNFTGSNLHDIITRNHNTLQNVQGGNAAGDLAGSGNAYHTMGYGYSDATATSKSAPLGWTIAHTGTGVYTITHNLTLTLPHYQAWATSNTSGVYVQWVDTSNTNAIVVHTVNTAGTATDASISFQIGNV